MAKKQTLADIIVSFLEEMIGAFIDDIKEKGVKAFPLLLTRISRRLLVRHIWLIILGLAGVMLISFGIAQLLTAFIPLWGAYMLVGVILFIIGVVQYHL